MVFVAPRYYRAALTAVASKVLLPCHVLVEECLETFVHHAVQSLPSRQKIHCRNAAVVAYVGGSPQEEPEVVLVSRTFLEVPGTFLRAPASVTQSTTEAVERHAKNPRRTCGA